MNRGFVVVGERRKIVVGLGTLVGTLKGWPGGTVGSLAWAG